MKQLMFMLVKAAVSLMETRPTAPATQKDWAKRIMIMHLTQSEVLYVIELYAPNSRENDSNEKEEKSRYKNAAVILLFGLTELPLPIIGIELVSGSSHGNEGEHNVSENESDTWRLTATLSVKKPFDQTTKNPISSSILTQTAYLINFTLFSCFTVNNHPSCYWTASLYFASSASLQ